QLLRAPAGIAEHLAYLADPVAVGGEDRGAALYQEAALALTGEVGRTRQRTCRGRTRAGAGTLPAARQRTRSREESLTRAAGLLRRRLAGRTALADSGAGQAAHRIRADQLGRGRTAAGGRAAARGMGARRTRGRRGAAVEAAEQASAALARS